jgi:hypothetical protein
MAVEGRRCRFVDPDVIQLPLSGGESITVKKELNAGEARHIYSDLVKTMVAGKPPELDAERVGVTKILAYVVQWSLLDREGHAQPVSEGALNLLDQDTYQEINSAVDTHDMLSEAARHARKNGSDGEMSLPATSPSPFAVAGVSSGSAS